jgi:uncharacterized protein
VTGPPAVAAWRHHGAREGFEVVFVRREGEELVLEGHATAVEEGEAWGVRYTVSVDSHWLTRFAHVAGRSPLGAFDVQLKADGAGGWRVGGRRAPELDGCLDVDLEASACTNALPVRRLGLAAGATADAPAAYVRATDARVERLEQRYTRLPNDDGRLRFDYAAPAFGYRDVIVYDDAGLVLDYPGIAVRVL